jgi:hypothetical protein
MQLRLRDANLAGQASFGELAIQDFPDDKADQPLTQFVKSKAGHTTA